MVGHARGGNAQLLEQLRTPKGRFALLGLRHHAEALAFADVGQHQQLLLGNQPRQRAADWVTARRAQAGRQIQQRLPVRLKGFDGL
ncbi:hypothetical protein BW43_01180 [Pseudomonas sp. RIT357]|nr:hypothetical protein BW43_01180 [Pseudomonas sp. RIT357]